jgi:hypothetical protein
LSAAINAPKPDLGLAVIGQPLFFKMKKYPVATDFKRAYTALKRAHSHIVEAGSEAIVCNHPCRRELVRLRQLTGFVQELMLDISTPVLTFERQQRRNRKKLTHEAH